MRVVVDTNVWVSGLIAPDGAPGRIVAAALHGEIDVVLSWELADELVDVLARPNLAKYGLPSDVVGTILMLLGPALPSVEVDVPVRDPGDSPVVAAALAGRAEAIVSGDRDLVDDVELRSWLAARGVEVATPAELVRRLA